MMMQETGRLSIEAHKLKEISMQHTCCECSLMRNYFRNKYEQLTQRTHRLEQLVRTNSKVKVADELVHVKQSLALVGLYMYV
jgi:queuine/archaeosine tRNA-ribosyltransferase